MDNQVTLVDVSYKAPKESNDVRVAVIGVLQDLFAKKSLTEIGVDNWQKAQVAIEGFQNLSPEFKQASGSEMELAGHFAGQIMSLLLNRPASPAPQA